MISGRMPFSSGVATARFSQVACENNIKIVNIRTKRRMYGVLKDNGLYESPKVGAVADT